MSRPSTAGDGPVKALVEFSRSGAARYMSHLDTARALRRSFARAGIGLALTEGLRPKVRLSLGLPLPVGAAGREELALAVLAPDLKIAGAGPDELAARLSSAAPEGVAFRRVEEAPSGLRLHPKLALYEWSFSARPEGMAAALEKFLSAAEVRVDRSSPKGSRTVDLRRYVVEPEFGEPGEDPGERPRLRFGIRHLEDGAARPREFLETLLVLAVAGTGGTSAGKAADDQRRPAGAQLERLGVVYDGLAPRGLAKEWLERDGQRG